MVDVCFSSDSSLVAFCCNDGSVGTFNIKNKKIDRIFTDFGTQEELCAVSLNSNDTLMAAASKQGKVVVRSLENNLTPPLQFAENIVCFS